MPATGLILAGARSIAALLGVRPSQVYYWTKAGMLPHFFVGRTLCADPDVLRAWVAERQSGASAARSVATDRT